MLFRFSKTIAHSILKHLPPFEHLPPFVWLEACLACDPSKEKNRKGQRNKELIKLLFSFKNFSPLAGCKRTESDDAYLEKVVAYVACIRIVIEEARD